MNSCKNCQDSVFLVRENLALMQSLINGELPPDSVTMRHIERHKKRADELWRRVMGSEPGESNDKPERQL